MGKKACSPGRGAREAGRPVIYLGSPNINKEAEALKIAARDDIASGLITVLTCVEPCTTFEIHRSREKKILELRPRNTTCLHHYRYMIDPVFGFMNARIQTYFPFKI